ncbi:MAG: phosphohistidine phosphatase [Rhodocyclaceae bacterium]|nr:MAG: phosphohistidine phosphatase [Rhodocyclaceae bacterium]
MVKKLNKLVGDSSENQLAATIKESAEKIWLAGLGAFSKTKEEGNKVFEALVREGEVIQSRTRKAAKVKVDEFAAKATGSWDKLEQVFEDRVAQALHSLGVPTKKDIDSLSKRVAELIEKMNASEKGAAAKPAARRRTAAQAAPHRQATKPAAHRAAMK